MANGFPGQALSSGRRWAARHRERWQRISLVGLLVLGGCRGLGEPVERVVVLDLVASFEGANVGSERGDFAVGTTGKEPGLQSGWSFPERDKPRNRGFRWGMRPASELSFTVVSPRDLRVRMEGLPAPDARAPRRIGILLNGESLGQLDVRKGWSEYAVDIPKARQRRGTNRLTLDYGVFDPTGSSAEGAQRPNLAMAWSRIAFDGLESPDAAPRAGDESVLVLPLGTQVEYLLEPADDARFKIDRWREIGNRSGLIEVRQEADDLPEVLLGSWRQGEEVEVALAPSEGPVRLSVTAIADGATGTPLGQASAVAIVRPRVEARSPAFAEPAIAEGDSRRPNIIVYLVDTLRSDRLASYGHDKDVSPHLDRFATTATLFENARAQSSWTLASMASIFTGVWPPAHGVVHPSMALNPEAITMAEILHSAGYMTSAIVTNGFVSDKFGLQQGFQDYKKIHRSDLGSDVVLAETINWLENRDRDTPFFLYLHTIDPHKPYLPDEEYRLRFAPEAGEMYETIRRNRGRNKWEPTESVRSQLLALYDASIAQNDAAFGATLDYLDEQDLFEDSLIVFLSDHGEEFYEHKAWTHGASLFSETLNVPLVIKLPGQKTGRRVERLAQHIDLLPTLLDYLGIGSTNLPGRSLLGDVEGTSQGSDAPAVFSHTFRNRKENRSVIDGSWKFIERQVPDDSWKMLINWEEDPGDSVNRALDYPIRTEYLAARVRRELKKRRLASAEEAVLDEATREGLRALGYLN